LVCAQEAYEQLELDEVVLMPVGEAPHREIEKDPGAELRAVLCEAAVDGAQWLTVSRVEVERGGQTYTVETLAELTQRNPETEYVFVLGADQARRLAGWREPERVLELAELAVAERSGASVDEVRETVAALGGGGRMKTFAMPRIDVSSTEIRARIATGRPYRFLVPERVAEIIEREGLYR
jgi:nicotinate-nucleotide adenylyltransferase